MKTQFTSIKICCNLSLLIMMGLWTNLFAQDKGFVHYTNSSNTIYNYTILDHPLLNDNPNAKVLFSQRYGPGAGSDNANSTGLWYTGTRWAIYNENSSIPMPIENQFNIFIADDSQVDTHIHTTSSSHVSYLSGYTEGDYLFHNNYYNPHSVYNNNIMGNYYFADGPYRLLYSETFTHIPVNAAFRIMKGSSTSSNLFSTTSSESNIHGQSLRLDHPQLNGNPDAVFVYSHYWGFPNPENQVYLPYVTEAFYTGGYWHIYAYDSPGFPANVTIDVIIPDEIMGVTDANAQLSKVTIYPNPVQDITHIKSPSIIEEIQLFNVQSQLVFQTKSTGNTIELDLTSLPAGLYIAKVKTPQGWIGQKLLKK